MKKLLFIGIIVLAAVLRLVRLDTVPPGVNRDEASIGYTAYSLMTTGKDEYGRSFPLSFESFGDWKLPLYIYTTIPFVKIFGLSELAVRLPSALAGIVSVGALYFLTRLLFASEAIALLSAAALAVSPWHIHISRVESEAIVAVLFSILGSLFFFKAIPKKSLAMLTTSSLLFAATYYTYHGNHISSSLLLLGFVIIYWKDILTIPRWWVAFGLGILLTLGILGLTLAADSTKISGISIFGDPTVIHANIELPRLEHQNPNSWVTKLTHNRVIYAATTIIHNYLKSYGSEFLFIKGGGNRAHNIQGYGNLHPLEAPFLLLGFAWLVMAQKKSSKFIIWWLVIGGVASAITKDAPHSNRMLAVVPALAVTIAVGIRHAFQLIPKRFRMALIIVLILGYALSLTNYLERYFVHFPKTEAINWGYAYKQIIPVLFSDERKDKNVIMSRPETSPYIYLLFYSGYSPEKYQKEVLRYPISQDGFTDVAGFGKFSFRAIDWKEDTQRKNTLLILDEREVPSELSRQIVSTVTLPDGSSQFVVLDTDK